VIRRFAGPMIAPDPELAPAASPVLSIRNSKRAFDCPASGVLLA